MSDYLDLPLERDPVIEAYKEHVDVTLLDANLRLTPAERLDRMQAFVRALDEVRGRARPGGPNSGEPAK